MCSSDLGYVFIMKHDDYITCANAFDLVIKVCQKFLSDCWKNNPYQDFLDQISVQAGSRIAYTPKIILGKAKDTVKKAVNFLMPG